MGALARVVGIATRRLISCNDARSGSIGIGRLPFEDADTRRHLPCGKKTAGGTLRKEDASA